MEKVMPRFKVKVIVKAQCEYTVEVDAENDQKAERAALSLDQRELPRDFRVNSGYITDYDCDVEQVSWNCIECGAEISEEQSDKNDDMCPDCIAAYDASEALTREYDRQSEGLTKQ
jgi:hypothetical protein